MKIEYLLTTHDVTAMPHDNVPEVVIVGKSNVGKSSLISFLGNDKTLARISKKPGKTKAISLFNVENQIRLIDIPGYGFSNVSKEQKKIFGEMMETFFRQRENIKLIVLLVDIRRTLSQEDLDMIAFLENMNKKFIIVGTKLDKTIQSERASFLKQFETNKPILISTFNGKGINDLIKQVVIKTIDYIE